MAGRTDSNGSTVLIGGHVKGGPTGAVATALSIGAQVMQIFIGSPQSWKEPSPSYDDLRRLVADSCSRKLGLLFVHGNYLVNLASPSEENWRKSVDNLSLALRIADRAGATALIFHPGSARNSTAEEAMTRVLHALGMVLSDYNGSCRLALEVCAGQGQTIGHRFSQFKEIISSMGSDRRLGVCWDTCHLFNAGYDISTAEGLAKTVDEFGEQVGFDWLLAIHANDSKTPLGACRDRHENIGCGHIGETGFRRMLHHPLLRPLPWILEVPGFEHRGPDKENIEILKRLARK